MLIKLHLCNGRYVHVNPEYIVEVLEYKGGTSSNGEPSPNASIVFNAAGHSSLNIDVIETPEQIAELCNPVLSAIDRTKHSVKGCINKLFSHGE